MLDPETSQRVKGEIEMTEAQIKHMVDRFLSWKLPRDTFNPDCGISFDKKPFNAHTPYPMLYEPSGTNLFDAGQADAMVRHMLEGLPPAATAAEKEDGFEWSIVEIFGHRSHRGRAREEERFGSKMLRIDEPTVQPDGSAIYATHYYSGSSIFSYTPTDEETVMRYAKRHYATPAIPYRAPAEDFEQGDGEQDGGGHD